MKRFTLQHFIDKFEAIPEERWCTGEMNTQDGRSCALGHCDNRNEAGDLDALTYFSAPAINDNMYGYYSHLGATPKARMINWLKARAALPVKPTPAPAKAPPPVAPLARQTKEYD